MTTPYPITDTHSKEEPRAGLPTVPPQRGEGQAKTLLPLHSQSLINLTIPRKIPLDHATAVQKIILP